jgi:hypothetical protein
LPAQAHCREQRSGNARSAQFYGAWLGSSARVYPVLAAAVGGFLRAGQAGSVTWPREPPMLDRSGEADRIDVLLLALSAGGAGP